MILITAIISPDLSANKYDLRVERIPLEYGLSHPIVTCIFQDSIGFLWFGTRDGLNRYDGYTFTVYKSDPEDPHSLSNDNVLSMYEARSGILWIGTENGLNRFDRDKEQFIH